MRQRALECLVRGAELEAGEQAARELLASIGVKLARSTEQALWSLRRQRALLRILGLGFRERREDQLAQSALRELDVLHAGGAQLARLDAVLGASVLARALPAARRLGEPQRLARALCTEAWNFVGSRSLERGRSASLIEAARALTERHGSPLIDGHLRLAQGMVALGAHKVRECSGHCRDAERVFRDSCMDVAWELGVAQVHQLFAASLMGHYRQLAPKLALCLREAEERGDQWTQSALLGVEALGLALARDAPERARERVSEARARWAARATLHSQGLFNLIALTAIDLYQRVGESAERLEQRLGELELRQFMSVPFARIALCELRTRARVLAAMPRPERAALRAIEAGAGRLFAEREQAASGFAFLLLANARLLAGERRSAALELERGIAALEPLGLGQWVLPARQALGRLSEGERGRKLADGARGQLKRQGVRNPERFAAMMLPALTIA